MNLRTVFERAARHTTDDDIAVQLESVTVRYRVPHERYATLKEHTIRLLQRRVQYDDFLALRDVSLTVRRGEVVGIIGRNGAGKSTLLKVIGRVLRPTRGRVVVRGRIAPLLELGAAFHPELTGRENIFLNGALLGFSRAEMQAKFDRIVDFAELRDFIDAPLRTYSSGMAARLGFAIATDVEPDILIIDEILSVGDAAFQQKSIERINAFHKKGLTIFLVSHNLDALRAMCDRAVWLENGCIAASGVTEQVIEAYLDDVAAREARLTPKNDQPIQQERWGSGEAQIVGVRFLDAQGRECDCFATDEAMIARIRYRAKQRIIQPVFGVAIYHSSGVHVNGPNTRFADYLIDWIEGEGEIDYIVPRLPLLEGEYDFSATVYDYSCTHPYDHRHRAYRFRVQNGKVKEKFGMFYMDSRWEHRRR